jgi:ABC-type branched-subunit amino acid transport system ATPase component
MKNFIIIVCFLLTGFAFGQVSEIKLNPEKVKKFLPYIVHKRGGEETFQKWKAVNKLQYSKEMWYYSESFYVKRNYFQEGTTLNEEIIDITRFENNRKENEETIVELPGFRDVIVLLPNSKLLYKL